MILESVTVNGELMKQRSDSSLIELVRVRYSRGCNCTVIAVAVASRFLFRNYCSVLHARKVGCGDIGALLSSQTRDLLR